MKKLVGLTIAFLIAAVVATWASGREAESILEEQYAAVGAQPNLKIIDRDYVRGVFASEEHVTLELFGEMAETMGRAGTLPADLKPLHVSVHSVIAHGPLPGFSTVAAAVVHSEVELQGAAGAEVQRLFGDRPPVSLRTVVRFDGSGRMTLSSPAFSTAIPAESGRSARVTWEGFEANLHFTRDMRRYRLDSEAPALAFEDDAGNRVSVSGMRYDGAHERVFEDEPYLFGGDQKLVADELAIRFAPQPDRLQGNLLLKKLAYAVSVPQSGDFLDLKLAIGAEAIDLDEQSYGPAYFDLSWNHLHARTLAKLFRTLQEALAAQAPQVPPDSSQWAAQLAPPFIELLQHDPEFRVDRLGFKSAAGEARCSMGLKLDAVGLQDLTLDALLVSKLLLTADVELPESLLGVAAGANEELALQQKMFLETFIDQGFVRRDGDKVSSSLLMRNGEITINGKPFYLPPPGPQEET